MSPEAPAASANDCSALATQIGELREQVARLVEQNEYLAARARAAEMRQREWDDLRHDMEPVANDLFCLTVEQLAELEPHVQLEDVLRLFKRLARNTRTLEDMLERLESTNDLLQDAAPLANDVFQQAVELLEELDRKGYFVVAAESMHVADAAVAALGREDLRRLADNIEPLIGLLKEASQPEVVALASGLVTAYREQAARPSRSGTISLLGLLRRLTDPRSRAGLAVGLEMVRALAPDVGSKPTPDEERNER